MSEENEWYHIADTVQGQIERVLKEEIMEAFKHLKVGIVTGSSEVYVEIILASGVVGIRVWNFAIEY